MFADFLARDSRVVIYQFAQSSLVKLDIEYLDKVRRNEHNEGRGDISQNDWP